MRLRLIPIIALVTAAFAANTVAEPSAESLVKLDIPGIVNFSKMSGSTGFAGPFVGFGGATEPSAMAALKEQGFTTVVSLRLATEEGFDVEASQQAATEVGLTYIHFPFNSKQPGPTDVEDFLEIIGDRANQPAYIHCGSATRASALWMIGRVLNDEWTREQAAEEARQIADDPAKALAFATQYLDAR